MTENKNSPRVMRKNKLSGDDENRKNPVVAEKGKKNGKAFVSKEEGERDRRNILVGKFRPKKLRG